MTAYLKELLKHYGLLIMTLNQLVRECPGTKYTNLEEYDKSLGVLLPDEPVVVVRISKDGKNHILKAGKHDLQVLDGEGGKASIVTLLELPEDEYWFFKAFRPAVFNLSKELPSFIYEMAMVHLYAVFEAYLSDLLRARLRVHPQLMGGQRHVKYEQIFEAPSKAELIDAMIEREVRELMYMPFSGLIQQMRDKLGFSALTGQHDELVNYLALVRNCLMHNGGRIDAKLARAKSDLHEHEKLSLAMADVDNAAYILRKFAYEIDKSFENIVNKGHDVDT